eukprot:2519630-Rhodomonas_salina.2
MNLSTRTTPCQWCPSTMLDVTPTKPSSSFDSTPMSRRSHMLVNSTTSTNITVQCRRCIATVLP